MDRQSYEAFFLRPTNTWHRRYEALRGFCRASAPVRNCRSIRGSLRHRSQLGQRIPRPSGTASSHPLFLSAAPRTTFEPQCERAAR